MSQNSIPSTAAQYRYATTLRKAILFTKNGQNWKTMGTCAEHIQSETQRLKDTVNTYRDKLKEQNDLCKKLVEKQNELETLMHLQYQ